MADLKQGINYEITAEDKTQQGTDSALANLLKAEKAAKDAAAKEKKEAADVKSVFGAVTQAVTGNFEALAAKIASVASKMKLLKLSAMAIGAVGAIVGSVVSIVKDLYNHWKSVREQIEQTHFDNILGQVDELKRDSADVVASLDLQKKKADALRDVLTSQVDATKKLRDAQLEYAKAQEMSLAKSEKERELIEKRYSSQKKNVDLEYAAQQREIKKAAAEAEIANIQKRIDAAAERERKNVSLANSYSREARNLAQPDGFFNMKHRGESGLRIKAQIKQLGAKQGDAWGEVQSAIKEQNELKVQLEAARKKFAALVKAQNAEVISEEATAMNDVTNRRIKAEKETKQIAEETEKLKADAERARKELADLAKKDAAEIAKARAKAEAEATRQREKEEKAAHDRRLKEIEAEGKALAESSDAANARLAAAKSAVQQAWGWYRDKSSMAAQLEEEKKNAEAEKQYEKDFAILSRRRDWETAKNLSVDQEAVRRVALAKREEAAAQKSYEDIARMREIQEEQLKLFQEEL